MQRRINENFNLKNSNWFYGFNGLSCKSPYLLLRYTVYLSSFVLISAFVQELTSYLMGIMIGTVLCILLTKISKIYFVDFKPKIGDSKQRKKNIKQALINLDICENLIFGEVRKKHQNEKKLLPLIEVYSYSYTFYNSILILVYYGYFTKAQKIISTFKHNLFYLSEEYISLNSVELFKQDSKYSDSYIYNVIMYSLISLYKLEAELFLNKTLNAVLFSGFNSLFLKHRLSRRFSYWLKLYPKTELLGSLIKAKTSIIKADKLLSSFLIAQSSIHIEEDYIFDCITPSIDFHRDLVYLMTSIDNHLPSSFKTSKEFTNNCEERLIKESIKYEDLDRIVSFFQVEIQFMWLTFDKFYKKQGDFMNKWILEDTITVKDSLYVIMLFLLMSFTALSISGCNLQEIFQDKVVKQSKANDEEALDLAIENFVNSL